MANIYFKSHLCYLWTPIWARSLAGVVQRSPSSSDPLVSGLRRRHFGDRGRRRRVPQKSTDSKSRARTGVSDSRAQALHLGTTPLMCWEM